MVDRETIIETGDGSAAGIVGGMLLVAAVVVGIIFFIGASNSGSKTIDLDVPAVTVNVTPDGQ